MAGIKKIAPLFLGLISVAVLLYFVMIPRILIGTDFTRSILDLIQKSKTSGLMNLSNFEKDSWDELVIWSPYTHIDEYQIDGIYYAMGSAGDNVEDGQNILLFLKDNKMKGFAKFDRRFVDLANLKLKIKKINRNQAVFKITGHGEFPKVIWIGAN